ncbi:MAG: hypothetical protein OEW24_10155 [Chloroflexota bacterium]|nr:hypothetical protein [Chloroflexota bacterium]
MSCRLLLALGAMMTLTLPATASAAPPAIHHTIDGRFASAYFTSLDACLQTDVWVSSSAATYAPQPGVDDTLNKQGLTSVEIVVYDTCKPMEGKHYPIVSEWFSQTPDRLVAESRIRTAHLDAILAMTDSVSGDTASVPVDLNWAATARAHPDPVRNNHVRFPGEGIVNTHDNNINLPAMAWGTVWLNGVNVAPEADESATLEQTKSSCMEIAFPHWTGDSLFCFGF